MVRQNIGGHGIGVAFHNAGDNKKESPQESIQGAQEPLQKTDTETVELGEQVFYLVFPAVMLCQQEFAVAQLDDTAKDQLQEIQSGAGGRDGSGSSSEDGGDSGGHLFEYLCVDIEIETETAADHGGAEDASYQHGTDGYAPFAPEIFPGPGAKGTVLHRRNLSFF